MTIYEGTIITCDGAGRVARYLVEDRGKIISVGNVDPARTGAPGAGTAARVCLGERALLPAFADTHIHFSSWSFFNRRLDVRAAKSNRELALRVAEAAGPANNRSRRGRTAPVLAYGASAHSVEEGRLVCRSDLDAALPATPAMVFKYDGHACVCNTAMLQLLPGAVRSLRGFHAESGELNQEAFFSASQFITRGISPVELLRGMLQGYEQLASRGIALIHSVEGVGFPKDIDVSTALFVSRGLKSPFRTRLFFQTMDVARVLRRNLPRIGGCFATALDGSFGSEDAALTKPYAHRPDYAGVLFYEQAAVTEFCRQAHRSGLQIAMHAIGDAAFHQALTALKTALTECPRADARHIIIHACLASEKDLEECSRLGIAIAAQTAMLDWPLEPANYLQTLLGTRAQRFLPLKTMRRLGLRVSLGSDAPVTLPDPMAWLHHACNHPNPSESVSVAEALAMLTREAAWMSFDERQTGSLEPGKAADMVVLSGNPLTSPLGRLRELKVERLLVRGRPWDCAGTVVGATARAVFRGATGASNLP